MFSLEGGQAAAARLIKRGVTGIICASDLLALGAIRAARRAGLPCPTTSRSSASTTRRLMNCTEPPLTTVRQPIEAMGRAAVTCWSPRSPAAGPRRRAAVRAGAGRAGLYRQKDVTQSLSCNLWS